MNAAQALDLARRGASLRASVAGVSITYGGSTFKVPVSAVEDGIDLEQGGFDRAVNLRFRFPYTITVPPAKGATIVVNATGSTFYVTSSQALPVNSLAGDYIVEARRA